MQCQKESRLQKQNKSRIWKFTKIQEISNTYLLPNSTLIKLKICFFSLIFIFCNERKSEYVAISYHMDSYYWLIRYMSLLVLILRMILKVGLLYNLFLTWSFRFSNYHYCSFTLLLVIVFSSIFPSIPQRSTSSLNVSE